MGGGTGTAHSEFIKKPSRAMILQKRTGQRFIIKGEFSRRPKKGLRGKNESQTASRTSLLVTLHRGKYTEQGRKRIKTMKGIEEIR